MRLLFFHILPYPLPRPPVCAFMLYLMMYAVNKI